MPRTLLAIPLAVLATHAGARAQEAQLPGASLMFTPASFAQDAPAEPEAQAPSDEQLDAPRDLAFGEPGYWHWSAGAGVGISDESVDVMGFWRAGTFLAQDFEFGMSLEGWAFFQDEGEDTGAPGFSIDFRWHFLNEESYSVYGLAGVGVFYAFDDVPDDGTQFNFTPTFGLGSTVRLGDGPARLDAGLRWHHISNATTSGSDDNPARDGLMVYLGIVFPF